MICSSLKTIFRSLLAYFFTVKKTYNLLHNLIMSDYFALYVVENVMHGILGWFVVLG